MASRIPAPTRQQTYRHDGKLFLIDYVRDDGLWVGAIRRLVIGTPDVYVGVASNADVEVMLARLRWQARQQPRP